MTFVTSFKNIFFLRESTSQVQTKQSILVNRIGQGKIVLNWVFFLLFLSTVHY